MTVQVPRRTSGRYDAIVDLPSISNDSRTATCPPRPNLDPPIREPTMLKLSLACLVGSTVGLAARILTNSNYGSTMQQGVFSIAAKKVPVELGVMSRCPDALVCEDVFNQVVQRVGDKVDLSLVYIAK